LIAQLIFVGLVTSAVYALVAVSLNLIYGTIRLLNIGHGDLVMVGAYVGYWVVTLTGATPILAFALAPMVTGLLGLFLYKKFLTGLLRQVKADSLEGSSLLIFFGISIILQNTAAYFFSGMPRAYMYYDRVIRIGDVAMTENRIIAFVVAVIAVISVLAFLKYSIWGLGIRALTQNPYASAIVGINVDAAFTLCTVAGFALAGLAGAVIGMYQATTPFMGVQYTTVAFVVIILGGLGNIAGSVVGAIIVGFLETAGTAITGPSYRDILIYGVFILILMIRPEGLLRKKART
jgi:branched-chain amino acid transport system permease protein